MQKYIFYVLFLCLAKEKNPKKDALAAGPTWLQAMRKQHGSIAANAKQSYMLLNPKSLLSYYFSDSENSVFRTNINKVNT